MGHQHTCFNTKVCIQWHDLQTVWSHCYCYCYWLRHVLNLLLLLVKTRVKFVYVLFDLEILRWWNPAMLLLENAFILHTIHVSLFLSLSLTHTHTHTQTDFWVNNANKNLPIGLFVCLFVCHLHNSMFSEKWQNPKLILCRNSAANMHCKV